MAETAYIPDSDKFEGEEWRREWGLYDRRTAPRRCDSWFLYCLVDGRVPDVIRYIGITNQPRARLSNHLSRSPHEGWHKSNWVRSVLRDGGSILMGLLASGLTHEAAQALEIKLIADLRAKGSALTNLTDGGDGVPGAKQSEETKAKKSASLKGRTFSEDHRRNLSEGLKGTRHSEESRSNMRSAHLRRYRDPAERQKQADGTRKRYESVEERERTRQSTLKRFAAPEERQKHSARMAEFLSDPVVRARQRLGRIRQGPQSNNKIGFKGVCEDKRRGGYIMSIKISGKKKQIKGFESAEQAAKAYDILALEAFGPEAYTNFAQLTKKG